MNIENNLLFMSVASPVFNTMFRPKAYKEGSILGREGLVQVCLPDDSRQAMAVLCYIFHLQSSKVPLAHITVDLPDEIATIVDKYDCAEAIQPWPEFWLVQESIQSSLKQHERIMPTTYNPPVITDFGAARLRIRHHREDSWAWIMGPLDLPIGNEISIDLIWTSFSIPKNRFVPSFNWYVITSHEICSYHIGR